MHENSFDLVQIGVSEQSWSQRRIEIECHVCFNMKYGHHQRADVLYTVDASDQNEKDAVSFYRLVNLFLV